MRFECDFVSLDDRRQQVTIPVALTADEIKAINCLRRDGDPHVDVKTQAYALRRAYQMAPHGYRHISGGVRQLMVN
jgi:hypothetical protein